MSVNDETESVTNDTETDIASDAADINESDVDVIESSASGEKSTLEKTTGFSVTLAVIVFLANMIAAWWITGESSKVISRPLIQDTSTAVSLAIENSHGATANNHVLLNRVLDTELMLRAAQNRHTITVVSLSVAFALVAIGFALFVMGAEGAFRLEGKAGRESNLMVKATAPGLLCFVLATVVVIFALLSRTELEPGDFTVYPDPGSGFASGDVAGATGAGIEAIVVGDDYYAPDGPDIPELPEEETAGSEEPDPDATWSEGDDYGEAAGNSEESEYSTQGEYTNESTSEDSGYGQ